MYQFALDTHGSGRRFVTGVLVLLLGLALTACGGSNGDSDPNSGSPPPSVTISGRITFDFVPSVPGGGVGAGLDYGNVSARPARGVAVEFIEGASAVTSTTADDDGRYSLSVPASRTGFVRARAEMLKSGQPAWDLSVVDNTNGDTVYAIDGTSFSTGTAGAVRDLHAASGWTGAGYTEPRAAAPFAILDAIADGIDLLLAADSGLVFPPLTIHWSPANIPSDPSAGIDPATGEIVTTFYSPDLGGMFVLGAEDSDTDEYDRHVLLHEWGHYVEDTFSRSDTINGPHTLGDILDMRVAFGEGWGNAFASMAAGDSVFRDVLGPGQGSAVGFDVEGLPPTPANPAPGWYSEQSVHELLWDLYDNVPDGADALSLGFNALYDVLTGAYRGDVALTSVFSFIDALKRASPAEAALIDTLVTGQSISAVADAWGTGETNAASAVFPEDVLPVYREISPGGASVNVCSTDEFVSGLTGLRNKLATRRFLRFDVPQAGNVSVNVTATSIPADQFADPDFIIHRAGDRIVAEDFPSAACEAVGSPGWDPADCSESVTAALDAGPHVLEVYEYTNTLDFSDDMPPIGRTCFDVMVSVP